MKPAPVIYRCPQTVEEAVSLVASYDGYGKFLAGGQTLGPMMNLRLAQPDLVVDISRLAKLRQVSVNDEQLFLGAGVSHAAIEDGEVPDVSAGLMKCAASGIAYRAVRNRGTIGGSLAHADPSAEWPTVMFALNATVSTFGPKGRRQIKASELFSGALTTILDDNELIETVIVPRLSQRARWGFCKSARKVGEFAHSMAVAIVDRDRGRVVVTLGALAETPLVLPQTSQLLINGLAWGAETERDIRAAFEVDIASAGIAPDDYEMQMHGMAVLKAVKQAIQ